MKFISLGGQCEVGWALKLNNLRDTAMPFDFVRSHFSGVIEYIQNNFETFFPKNITIEKIGEYTAFRGKNIGFFHHDLNDPEIIEAFKRRFKRFNEMMLSGNKIIFIRSIDSINISTEIEMIDKFHQAIKEKFPNLKYLLCLVILNQSSSKHVLTLNTSNNQTAIFT